MAMDATKKWPGPPRRRVYLMRHGEVDYFDAQGRPYPVEAVPLNAAGRAQAEAAAVAVADVPLDRVVTSGLRRCVETAEVVAAGRGLTAEVRPELREIEPGRFRDWGGVTPDEVRRAILGALDTDIGPDTRFLGGETFGELQARAGPCFRQLLDAPEWKHLLLVAHGVVNRLLLAGVLGAGWSALAALEQDAGCINLIEVDNSGRCLVRLVNHTPAAPLKAGMEMSTLELLYWQYSRTRPPE
jgi:probable phosphoglycerate mutase